MMKSKNHFILILALGFRLPWIQCMVRTMHWTPFVLVPLHCPSTPSFHSTSDKLSQLDIASPVQQANSDKTRINGTLWMQTISTMRMNLLVDSDLVFLNLNTAPVISDQFGYKTGHGHKLKHELTVVLKVRLRLETPPWCIFLIQLGFRLLGWGRHCELPITYGADKDNISIRLLWQTATSRPGTVPAATAALRCDEKTPQITIEIQSDFSSSRAASRANQHTTRWLKWTDILGNNKLTALLWTRHCRRWH